MSAAACAVVSSVTFRLFDVFGSAVVAPAVAVFVRTPAVGSSTWSVTVTLARNAMSPSAQLTLPPAGVQLPCIALTPTNVEPGGSVSVSVAPIASFGPLLSIRIVYVKTPPAGPGSGLSAWLTTRSASWACAGAAATIRRPQAVAAHRRRATVLCGTNCRQRSASRSIATPSSTFMHPLARGATSVPTIWPNRDSPGSPLTGTAEERLEFRERLLGRLLGQVVAAGQRPPADIHRNRRPILERPEQPVNDATIAPQHEERTRHLAARRNVFGIVLKIDRRGGAVILAAGVDRRGIREASLVLGERARVEMLR